MAPFGIEFAPLNVPLERRLQTLAAAMWFLTLTCGGFVGLSLAIYSLFTSWRWLTAPYLIWMFTIDRNASSTGARRTQWVRRWVWWTYLKNYFPLSVEVDPSVDLNPKKNYLFCGFPHGMLCTSQFSAFATHAGGFHKHFPHHTPYPLVLKQMIQMPFFRELYLAMGVCDSSAESINYLLGKPGGGNVVGIAVGGAAEAFNCRPRQYKIVLKNRKGFVKLALRNGAPLVPVISFGETDLYDQVDNPKGSFIRAVQEFLKKCTGMAPTIPIGRGFFQYSFGLIPRRKPVTMFVGRPIDVEKVQSPSQEQIDGLHSKFVEELTKLFEGEKHRFISDAEDVHLEIQ